MLPALICLLFFVSSNLGADISPKHTKSSTGCACWFDLEGDFVTPNSCACCKSGGIQCGYPKHNYCAKREKNDKRTGCKGIDQWKFTLSEVGHPCNFDPSRRDCAWCTFQGFQCGNFTDVPKNAKEGRYCKRFSQNHQNCFGTSQDCRNNPGICDPNASCVDTKKRLFKKWKRWSCACNAGFIGNGLTCVEADTFIKPAQIPDQYDVEVILTSEFTSVPEGPVPKGVIGPSDNNLLDEMDDMLDSGVLCPGCNGDIVTCEA